MTTCARHRAHRKSRAVPQLALVLSNAAIDIRAPVDRWQPYLTEQSDRQHHLERTVSTML
jgi:hypothetical protein